MNLENIIFNEIFFSVINSFGPEFYLNLIYKLLIATFVYLNKGLITYRRLRDIIAIVAIIPFFLHFIVNNLELLTWPVIFLAVPIIVIFVGYSAHNILKKIKTKKGLIEILFNFSLIYLIRFVIISSFSILDIASNIFIANTIFLLAKNYYSITIYDAINPVFKKLYKLAIILFAVISTYEIKTMFLKPILLLLIYIFYSIFRVYKRSFKYRQMALLPFVTITDKPMTSWDLTLSKELPFSDLDSDTIKQECKTNTHYKSKKTLNAEYKLFKEKMQKYEPGFNQAAVSSNSLITSRIVVKPIALSKTDICQPSKLVIQPVTESNTYIGESYKEFVQPIYLISSETTEPVREQFNKKAGFDEKKQANIVENLGNTNQICVVMSTSQINYDFTNQREVIIISDNNSSDSEFDSEFDSDSDADCYSVPDINTGNPVNSNNPNNDNAESPEYPLDNNILGDSLDNNNLLEHYSSLEYPYNEYNSTLFNIDENLPENSNNPLENLGHLNPVEYNTPESSNNLLDNNNHNLEYNLPESSNNLLYNNILGDSLDNNILGDSLDNNNLLDPSDNNNHNLEYNLPESSNNPLNNNNHLQHYNSLEYPYNEYNSTLFNIDENLPIESVAEPSREHLYKGKKRAFSDTAFDTEQQYKRVNTNNVEMSTIGTGPDFCSISLANNFNLLSTLNDHYIESGNSSIVPFNISNSSLQQYSPMLETNNTNPILDYPFLSGNTDVFATDNVSGNYTTDVFATDNYTTDVFAMSNTENISSNLPIIPYTDLPFTSDTNLAVASSSRNLPVIPSSSRNLPVIPSSSRNLPANPSNTKFTFVLSKYNDLAKPNIPVTPSSSRNVILNINKSLPIADITASSSYLDLYKKHVNSKILLNGSFGTIHSYTEKLTVYADDIKKEKFFDIYIKIRHITDSTDFDNRCDIHDIYSKTAIKDKLCTLVEKHNLSSTKPISSTRLTDLRLRLEQHIVNKTDDCSIKINDLTPSGLNYKYVYLKILKLQQRCNASCDFRIYSLKYEPHSIKPLFINAVDAFYPKDSSNRLTDNVFLRVLLTKLEQHLSTSSTASSSTGIK